jgi:hypothetical protein
MRAAPIAAAAGATGPWPFGRAAGIGSAAWQDVAPGQLTCWPG